MKGRSSCLLWRDELGLKQKTYAVTDHEQTDANDLPGLAFKISLTYSFKGETITEQPKVVADRYASTK